jgi:hypothetical protein
MPGVIDAIADGLSVVIERPFLMVIPMLLDLYYWLGWKLTVDAVTNPLQRWVSDQNVSNSQQTVERLASIGRSDVLWSLSIFVPALLADTKRSDVYTVHARPVISPPAWLDAALLPLIVVASLTLAMVYMVPLADCIAHRRRSVAGLARAVATGSLRFVAVIGLVIAILTLVAAPVLVGSIVLYAAGIDPTVLLALTFPFAVLGAALVCWFVPEAIVVSEVSPLRAISNSVAVVRGYFWQTLGLVVATFIISAGLGSIFERVAYTAPGLLIGVVGNAFVGTGLAMASMGFYASRIDSLKPESRSLDRDQQPQLRP